MLRPFGLALVVSCLVACNSSVVENVESAGSGGGGGNEGTTSPLACGEQPSVGQIISACQPMDGDYCLPAETSPGLLAALGKENGVCAETSATACCDKPAYRQVVCDQPPGTNTCCYDVHFIEKVVCP